MPGHVDQELFWHGNQQKAGAGKEVCALVKWNVIVWLAMERGKDFISCPPGKCKDLYHKLGHSSFLSSFVQVLV